jgi:hypothetical protein
VVAGLARAFRHARDERVHDAYFISLHFAGDDVSVMQLFPDASEISS